MKLEIHDDIRRAATLPAEFYRSPEMFAACRERIFARSWQMIVGAEDYVRVPGDALPFVYSWKVSWKSRSCLCEMSTTRFGVYRTYAPTEGICLCGIRSDCNG
ncbi:MAG: hypothetical protein RMJ47_06495 [Bacteroidota bacterium]|nr:hypothetical protein [Bacteroidota bacterium]